jgi:hypothetical protein
MRLSRAAAAAWLMTAAACASSPPVEAIARERAIAIAEQQVRWQPFDVQATRLTAGGRSVWRVTLKGRLPGQPPLLFETAVVEVDAKTGDVLSVAKT